ncbi:hypothetical protein WDY80_00125 [Gordonia hongkongensis]|uniref:hypothetical protein n=1 Tax=Gordonia hongkongensis TaxID=1701090 RepID=UPI0030D5EC65
MTSDDERSPNPPPGSGGADDRTRESWSAPESSAPTSSPAPWERSPARPAGSPTSSQGADAPDRSDGRPRPAR